MSGSPSRFAVFFSERVTGTAAILAWVTVFALGSTVSSAPFREELGSGTFSLSKIWSMAVVLVTYTPPNIAVLCCLASVAGSIGSGEGLVSATVRGFFVYLLLLSGVLLMSGTPFEAPTQSQYIRLAGTSSMFCFVVGWQPALLATLMDRVIKTTKIEGRKDDR